jgi:Asp-tRNA(Asn)/Glu-tRNA(Gln) amidotransferase A subunit family amidase
VYVEQRLDALVMPTLPRVSMPVADMVIPVDLPRYIPFTIPWNLTGQPALTVPCGLSFDGPGGTDGPGRPVGLQIVGRPFDEAMVLRIGRAYQEATDWHERRPPLPGA